MSETAASQDLRANSKMGSFTTRESPPTRSLPQKSPLRDGLPFAHGRAALLKRSGAISPLRRGACGGIVARTTDRRAFAMRRGDTVTRITRRMNVSNLLIETLQVLQLRISRSSRQRFPRNTTNASLPHASRSASRFFSSQPAAPMAPPSERPQAIRVGPGQGARPRLRASGERLGGAGKRALKPATASADTPGGGRPLPSGAMTVDSRSERAPRAAATLALALLFGLAASEAHAGIAFVKNVGTNASATTGTTIAVTVPAAGVAAGNSVVLALAMGDAAGPVSGADSAGNVYDVAADVTNASHVRTVILATHNVAALASGNTITVTHPSVAARALSANEFSGVSKTAALDQTSTAAGASTSPSSGSTAATTRANELLIGAIGVDGPLADTFTAGGSYTALTRAGMGIVLRASASVSGFNGTSLSISKPAGVVAGDVLVASVDAAGGSGTTITAPSGWTLIRRDDSGTTLAMATYYKVAGSSEPASYSWGLGSSNVGAGGGIIAYANVDTGAPLNASGGQVNSSSASVTAPSITTTVPNTMLVGFFGIASQSSFTAPSGMMERYGVSSGGSTKVSSEGADVAQPAAGASGTKVATASSAAVNIGHLVALAPAPTSTINPEYRLVSATGAYSADGTLSPSRSWAAAIATFKAGVCGDGFVDPGESCDLGVNNGATGSCCTASCTFVPSSTVCRAAVNECDIQETCTGTSATCPADAVKAAGTACTDDGHDCTSDVCNGTVGAPACTHAVKAAGTACT